MTKHHKKSHHGNSVLYAAAVSPEYYQSNQHSGMYYHNDKNPAHRAKKELKHAKKELEHEIKHCCTIV